MKLFLDDIREPEECVRYMHRRIGELFPIYEDSWVVVRTYEDFVSTMSENFEIITHVSFDHDLGEDAIKEYYNNAKPNGEIDYNKINEKTGLDCAKWMKDFYIEKEKELPILFIHSMNPVGTQNIINVFK